MDTITVKIRPYEAQRTQVNHLELIDRITQAIAHDGLIEPLHGLFLHRASAPTEPIHGITIPSFCVVAQGCKLLLLGEDQYYFAPGQHLLATAELPYMGHVLEATPDQPYLSMRLNLDPIEVGSVLVDAGYPKFVSTKPVRALNVSSIDGRLLDAMVRFARLIAAPHEQRFLAPMLRREIIYHLLASDQGARLRQIAVVGGATHRIATAIAHIRNTFAQPLSIEEIANDAGMSVSSFHHHFKSITALSPLQFQKHLRLQEARRLLLGGQLDVTRVGFLVGYADSSQFNREYKRLFGLPPLRDTARLRETVLPSDNH